ncbi:Ornithine carbamoyltransferase [Candidatus Burkholderia humilis]|nr:Ornithine carbamoyltransferase [Candidatus Burkholderia humilis]
MLERDIHSRRRRRPVFSTSFEPFDVSKQPVRSRRLRFMTSKKIRHYLQFKDFSLDDYEYVLERARILKRKFKNYETYHPLHDRTLAMIFEKSSTRTRLSFEAGIFQLGGHAVFMNTRDTQLGRGEPIEDSAQVISRMVDIIMIRTFGQDIIRRFAESSRVPVINGLTNEYHPCQVLADIFTFYEHRGPISGKTVAWVGDANNMLYTWFEAAQILGFKLRLSTPDGYKLDPALVSEESKPFFEEFDDPNEACASADLVTTDVWTSMGFEAENEARMKAFADYCVDAEMMSRANPDAPFMHCLPAHRGEEVSAEVIDGSQSVVWDEAENRLHVQKALMEYLLLGKLNH